MERIVRYKNLARALEVGELLDNAYPREFLTGLNFIVEQGGAVIVAAVFEDKLIASNPVIINILMLPGEVLKLSVDNLVRRLAKGTMTFLGDGLEPFAAFCRTKGVRKYEG